MTGSPRFTAGTPTPPRVLVVGAGFRFVGGLSQYTRQLALALHGCDAVRVSVVLMRQIIPTRLYPGARRVGAPLSDATYPAGLPVFDGIDWYWLPSLGRALRFLRRQRPHFALLQWWTGAVLHTYLVLAVAVRAFGGRVVIEFHEVQDPGEAQLPFARVWMRFLARFVTRCAHGFVIHSESDRDPLARSYGIADRPIAVIPHGPYDHYRLPDADQPLRAAPAEACNLLFFGLIRPYKGLEDAVRAFEALCDESPSDFWLTVVGETWERWTLPGELIGASRHGDRITFVNRYVTDAEAARFFAGADVVVLPYRRGSASGTLHAAMALGLPVVATAVGGLREATMDYEGAVLTAPDDANALEDALRRASTLRGMRFRDPHSWQRNVAKLLELFGAIERDR